MAKETVSEWFTFMKFITERDEKREVERQVEFQKQMDMLEKVLTLTSVARSSNSQDVNTVKNVPSFPAFTGTEKEDLEPYIFRLDQHFEAHSVVTEEQKRAYFLSWVGNDTYSLLRKLYGNEDISKQTYENIIQQLKDYYKSTTHVLSARYKFNKTTMKSGQSYAGWVADLRGVARDCNFICTGTDCEQSSVDEHIRDIIVLHTPHDHVRTVALQSVNPSLEDVLKIAEIYESTQQAKRSLTEESSSYEVCKISSSYKKSRSTEKSSFIDNKSNYEDRFPPVVVKNTGLQVKERSHGFITFEQLFAVDDHSDTSSLEFLVISGPSYGYLDFAENKGVQISKFLASDLLASRIRYVHNSILDKYFDHFTFKVSDGKNYILQTFYISTVPENDTRSYMRLKNLVVKEGNFKTISEFEIDVVERRTEESLIMFKVISPPRHGTLNFNNSRVVQFSLEDIYNEKISYQHDGSDTLTDEFSFTVFNEVKRKFIHLRSNKTDFLVLHIDVQKVDDAIPIVTINKKLHLVKLSNGQYFNTITNDVLFAEDFDTESEHILYVVTVQPRLGSLRLASSPGETVFNFTQMDINNERLQYILYNDDFVSVEDKFMFSVQDNKPNKVSGNIFHIYWSRIHFVSPFYNISEVDEAFEIPIRRIGNLDTNFIVYCDSEPEMPLKIFRKGHFGKYTHEVYFSEGNMESYCTFKVINNNRFEGKRTFQISISSDKALIGIPATTLVDVYDEEDEPVIYFEQSSFVVNETTNSLLLPVFRKGDTSKPLSLFCTTHDVTAKGSKSSTLGTGSDYRSRDASYGSLITFPARSNETSCKIRIIDDSLFEEDEEFQVILSNPQPVGKLSNVSKAWITILGPNDGN